MMFPTIFRELVCKRIEGEGQIGHVAIVSANMRLELERSSQAVVFNAVVRLKHKDCCIARPFDDSVSKKLE
jgi:hypothetical protein